MAPLPRADIDRRKDLVMNLGGPELLIVLVIVLLILGARRVPDLARSLGEAQREFKRGSGRRLDADTIPSAES